ncbi:MAG: hydrogenase maturation protease [Methanosarcinales archaeon]|nr:hydrogenase maturation protease [Methanosarcinales archaeon]
MTTKVIFVGSILRGDDGIGPFLYNELKDHPELRGFEMLELGVIGFDMISYIEEGDRLIIVDAVHTIKDIGKVVVLKEKDLSQELSLVSQHDFGVEQTAALLRRYIKDLQPITVIGINVTETASFIDVLSKEIMTMIPGIKTEVVKKIIKAAA